MSCKLGGFVTNGTPYIMGAYATCMIVIPVVLITTTDCYVLLIATPPQSDTINYHTLSSRKCIRVNEEALKPYKVFEKLYFLLQVVQESVSVLQVKRETISGTTSHMCCV